MTFEGSASCAGVFPTQNLATRTSTLSLMVTTALTKMSTVFGKPVDRLALSGDRRTLTGMVSAKKGLELQGQLVLFRF